jgi:UDP-glucose 4-epimerase
MRVLVTGASGYIGGQTAIQLRDQGHEVFGLDWARLPEHLYSLNLFEGFLQFDFDHLESHQWIWTIQPDAIIHCAGTSLVGPSMKDPETYYENNFVKTKHLLDFLRSIRWTGRFIFSSSAATYGNPVITPCCEVDPTEPISPYGESKLMIEWLLKSYQRAYGLDYVAFRYFNACGADPQARHGQAPGATHIVARILENYLAGQDFVCNGNDYDTPDGTGVRDYIHVVDLAKAHLAAIEHLDHANEYKAYNIGTGVGVSVLEIVKAFEAASGKNIAYQIVARRPGDIATCYADPNLAQQELGWKAELTIQQSCEDAWRWQSQNPNGYDPAN